LEVKEEEEEDEDDEDDEEVGPSIKSFATTPHLSGAHPSTDAVASH
jgi:hypothetical protein